mmetsp:Transcript_70265/g.139209  ORF Transcript_70265/g.139209 Transcript_70265/m.139209 type:complete len:526 (-) Transcript_70265:98-1675(-)
MGNCTNCVRHREGLDFGIGNDTRLEAPMVQQDPVVGSRRPGDITPVDMRTLAAASRDEPAMTRSGTGVVSGPAASMQNGDPTVTFQHVIDTRLICSRCPITLFVVITAFFVLCGYYILPCLTTAATKMALTTTDTATSAVPAVPASIYVNTSTWTTMTSTIRSPILFSTSKNSNAPTTATTTSTSSTSSTFSTSSSSSSSSRTSTITRTSTRTSTSTRSSEILEILNSTQPNLTTLDNSTGGNLHTTTKPNPLEKPTVIVSMTVANIDYSKLMELPSVLQAFRACVRRTLALQAGRLMPLNSIKLQLMPGSVRVNARIASLDNAEASSLQSKLRASPSITATLATRIEGVNGIAAACTGPVSVTSFNTSSEMKLSTGPSSSQASALLIGLMGFSIFFLLATAGLAMILLGNFGVTSSTAFPWRWLLYDMLRFDESRTNKASYGHPGCDYDLEDRDWDTVLDDREEGDAGRLQLLRSSRSSQARFRPRHVPRTGEALETIPEGSDESLQGSPRSSVGTIISNKTEG